MTVPARITILPFTLIRTGLPPMKKTLSDAAKLRVTIHDEDGSKTTANYRIFVDCGGQEPLELQRLSFPKLGGCWDCQQGTGPLCRFRGDLSLGR